MIKCLSLTGLILIALEGITTGAIVAQNRDHYGAIATSTTNPAIWGYSHGYPTLAQAQRYALEYCGQADCQIRVWFKNGCGAIATNGSNIGSAWAVNRAEAEARSIVACGQGDCKIEVWACTTHFNP
ncbi:DUF4189 domain-containing protein [Limnospira fusiformis]|uniref:DUF4189 domain-containing protein n=1 Tax=Limnospira fusiformis TaxID=54297 RepID=UPI002AA16B16|nr:DUF4189 domain-containing protein [Limnospira fusiformis LS22]